MWNVQVRNDLNGVALVVKVRADTASEAQVAAVKKMRRLFGWKVITAQVPEHV